MISGSVGTTVVEVDVDVVLDVGVDGASERQPAPVNSMASAASEAIGGRDRLRIKREVPMAGG